MKTFGFWFYQELQPLLGLTKPSITLYDARGKEYSVKASSTRLELFVRNPKCAHCKRVGELWLLQSHVDEKPHLNLYAVSKRDLILMTQDHIMPKSRGGSDDISNLQTMCTQCNKIKGNSIHKHLIKAA